jgi:stage II sporulation protein D
MAARGANTAATGAEIPGTISRTMPGDRDSLTIILFAGFHVTYVRATAPSELIVHGAPKGETRWTEIRAADEGISVDGVPARACTLSTVKGEMAEIQIAERRRTVRGVIICRRIGGELRVTARVAVRDYLASTLCTEASSADPMEYLTALAVLQRNYLAEHAGRHAPEADLCDNTHCQRADAGGVTPRIYEAVDRASTIALDAAGGHPCYYSVNCGGSTLTPAQVWKHAEAGYSNVRCTRCANSIRYRWTRSTPATPRTQELLRTAPATPFVDDDFKTRLGREIGFNKILSNTIDRIERRGAAYIIEGRGFGHRVGMCQEGARQLALHGWKADAILRFYFPAARVSLPR